MVKILAVAPGSPAEKAGILPSDFLIGIDGHPVQDVLDYRFYMTEPKIELEILRADKPLLFTVRKGQYDDVGLEFESYLMDSKQRCRNRCIFCFIDQNPSGMRDAVYFKDDDSRLSFFFGNYITLTNLSDEDVDRIIRMRISPVNISVHTTNPALRVKMMGNRNAGKVLRYLDRFYEGGITMNFQIVLCRGVNDGQELKKTLEDLSLLEPWAASIAVVPAGLTHYRDGLYPLEPFDAQSSRQVLRAIDAQARDNLAQFGKRLIYASDEWFVNSGLAIPDQMYYEDYPQIENGVGMLRSMEDEIDAALADFDGFGMAPRTPRRVSVATGQAAYPYVCQWVEKAKRKFPMLSCTVHCVQNRFFGGNVTVAGLLTASDLLETLPSEPLGEVLLIPSAMLRHEGDLFLDGMSLEELTRKLGVAVVPIGNDGREFIEKLMGIGLTEKRMESAGS